MHIFGFPVHYCISVFTLRDKTQNKYGLIYPARFFIYLYASTKALQLRYALNAKLTLYVYCCVLHMVERWRTY